MSQDDLAERLDAVERRLDAAYPEPADGAVDSASIERIETFAERLADLEAAVEAVEGYVGEIERVDDELERRADAALAATDGIEERLDAVEGRLERDGPRGGDDIDDVLADQGATLAELQRVVDGLDDRVATIEDEPERASAESGRRFDPTDSAADVADERPHLCDCGDSPAGSAAAEPTPRTAATRSTPDGFGERADDAGSTCHSESSGDDPVAGTTPADPLGSASTPGPGDESTVATPRPEIGSSGASADERERATDRSTADRARSAPVERSGSAPTEGPGPTPPRSSVPAVGTDGGQRREEPAAGSTISGWGDPAADAVESEGSSRQRTDESDGRDWADANTETLLDRLRSLL